MLDVSTAELLDLLKPVTPWDFLLYVILVFLLITLFMQPEGALTVTILLAIVVVGIFIDKVQALGKCGIEVMLIRVLYFVVPLITAGVTENPKARPPAVIAALLGLAYVFGTWFFVLNSDACPREARDTVILLPLSLHFA